MLVQLFSKSAYSKETNRKKQICSSFASILDNMTLYTAMDQLGLVSMVKVCFTSGLHTCVLGSASTTSVCMAHRSPTTLISLQHCLHSTCLYCHTDCPPPCWHSIMTPISSFPNLVPPIFLFLYLPCCPSQPPLVTGFQSASLWTHLGVWSGYKTDPSSIRVRNPNHLLLCHQNKDKCRT